MIKASQRRRLWGDAALVQGGALSAAVAVGLPRWLIGFMVIVCLVDLALFAWFLRRVARHPHP